MKGKILISLAVAFLLVGCASFGSMSAREEKYGKASPVIQQAFASKIMGYNDTWKVYLKASDADGDMKAIVSFLEKGGRGADRATSFTGIKEENGKEFSGYLYWYPGSEVRHFSEILMVIQIQDRAGHYSDPVSLPLSIKPSGKQEPPPKDVFPENNLGPIMITIKPAGSDSGSGQ
jgi:hypothetical protein